jgi:hypothetical protein
VRAAACRVEQHALTVICCCPRPRWWSSRSVNILTVRAALSAELEIFRPRMLPCHFSNPFRCYILLPLNRGTGPHGERSER